MGAETERFVEPFGSSRKHKPSRIGAYHNVSLDFKIENDLKLKSVNLLVWYRMKQNSAEIQQQYVLVLYEIFKATSVC